MTVVAPLFRAAGQIVSPGGANGKLTILTYHRVLPEADPLLSSDQIDATKFASHMEAVASSFNVLPLPEALERLKLGTLPARAASITFDDGYQDNYTIALPILKRHGLKATFFVCSGYLNDGLMFNDVIVESLRAAATPDIDLSWLGLGQRPLNDIAAKRDVAEKILIAVKYLPFEDREQACTRMWETTSQGRARPRLMMTDEELRQLASHGMTIGAHTHTHPILNRIDLDAARRDIQRNRDLLKALVGSEPLIFAYPNGRPVRDYGYQHVELLQQLGFQAAVSSAWGIATRTCDPYQLPRFAPWDNDPKRLVLRLLKNAMTGQHPLVAPKLS